MMVRAGSYVSTRFFAAQLHDNLATRKRGREEVQYFRAVQNGCQFPIDNHFLHSRRESIL